MCTSDIMKRGRGGTGNRRTLGAAHLSVLVLTAALLLKAASRRRRPPSKLLVQCESRRPTALRPLSLSHPVSAEQLDTWQLNEHPKHREGF